MRDFNSRAAVLPLLAALLAQPACGAEGVYKCVVNGRTSYTSSPPADGQCEQTVIRDDGPSPEELERLQAERQRRLEAEERAKEAALREREVRAKEMEAEAARSRARAEELQMLQPDIVPAQVQTYSYPYYWGGRLGRPLPRPVPTLTLPAPRYDPLAPPVHDPLLVPQPTPMGLPHGGGRR